MIHLFAKLILCLVLLGVSVEAQSYPAATVGMGSNPVRSSAGIQDLAGGFTTPDVIAASEGQDLILTDIFLGYAVERNDAYYSGYVQLIGSDGVTYGSYVMQAGRLYDGGVGVPTNLAGSTGIRIPAGVSLSIQWTLTYQSEADYWYTGAYTLSGYLAKP